MIHSLDLSSVKRETAEKVQQRTRDQFWTDFCFSSMFWIKHKIGGKELLHFWKQFRKSVGCWKIWHWCPNPNCMLHNVRSESLCVRCHDPRVYLLYFRVVQACGASAAMWGGSCPIVARSWLGFCCVWGNRQMQAARLCHWPAFWGRNKQKYKLGQNESIIEKKSRLLIQLRHAYYLRCSMLLGVKNLEYDSTCGSICQHMPHL